MYSTSAAYKTEIKANGRRCSVKVVFPALNVTLDGTKIVDMELDDVINASGPLTMGSACANKVTINLINPPTNIQYAGAIIIPYSGLLVGNAVEWVPLGKFYVTDYSSDDDLYTLKLTAYDGMIKLSDTYTPSAGATTVQALYDDLKSKIYTQYGITMKTATVSSQTVDPGKIPEGCTYLQALGILAGLCGGHARVDRAGEIEIVWFPSSADLTIGRDEQYMQGFKKTTEATIQVTSLVSGTQENVITAGSGIAGSQIMFENPLMTQAILNEIWNARKTGNYITYQPAELEWHGNPALMCGDSVSCVDKDNNTHLCFVMEQAIKLTGGISGTLKSYGEAQNKVEFTGQYSSMSKSLTKIYTTLETAIKQATELITGNQGGYVVLHDSDNDGYPDEILVMDQPDIAYATKVWRWNQAGLGYSGNGYNGTFGLAMTMNGAIVADYITTGNLSANRIYGGTLTLGGYDNQNGQLVIKDASGNAIGTWDHEGLETGDFHVVLENGALETYIGGFYAYTSQVSGGHYLATQDQVTGIGDYDDFAIWTGASGQQYYNNPKFCVKETGEVTFTTLHNWYDPTGGGSPTFSVDSNGNVVCGAVTAGAVGCASVTASGAVSCGSITANGGTITGATLRNCIFDPAINIASVTNIVVGASTFTLTFSDSTTKTYSYTVDNDGRITGITLNAP